MARVQAVGSPRSEAQFAGSLAGAHSHRQGLHNVKGSTRPSLAAARRFACARRRSDRPWAGATRGDPGRRRRRPTSVPLRSMGPCTRCARNAARGLLEPLAQPSHYDEGFSSGSVLGSSVGRGRRFQRWQRALPGRPSGRVARR